MTIDYRDLLKRYIQRVGDAEGSTFLPYPGALFPDDVSFTAAEIDELSALEAEGDAERAPRRSAAFVVTMRERKPSPPTPIHPDEIVENVDPMAGREGEFPIKLRCVIREAETAAMERPGRTFGEREIARRSGISDRLKSQGFDLDENGTPRAPWWQWDDAEAGAITFVQWQKGNPA